MPLLPVVPAQISVAPTSRATRRRPSAGSPVTRCVSMPVESVEKSSTDSVSSISFQDDPTICQSAMSQSNLEAVVSPACEVDWLKFTVVGPEDYREQHREYVGPYFLYSNNAGNIGHSHDDFPAGSYTVDATVKLDSPSRHESASLTFAVDGSC